MPTVFGKISRTAFSEGNLAITVKNIIDGLNALWIKLDADSATHSNYSSSYAIAWSAQKINPHASKAGAIVSVLKQARTNWDAACDTMNADASPAATTTIAALKFGTTHLVDVAGAKIKALGYETGAMANFIDAFITKFNALLAILDADSGIGDTNYVATLALTDVVK